VLLVAFSWAQAQSQPPAGAKTFTQEELDQLLAPIALYPDDLLAQVLMASTYPLEVIEAARWSKANPNVKEKALEEAMQKQSWDPSVKALTAVPQVLEMMNEKLDWMQKLGDAFLAQQQDVMNTVQALRKKAQEAGNLKNSKEQTVNTEGSGDQTNIIIESAEPEVVYVPVYDPGYIYGSWWYPAYPPYYWYPPGYRVGYPGIWFGAGIIVGGAIWGGCDWQHHNVRVDPRKYNDFNRTKIDQRDWQHNAEHRKGVAYRDASVQQRYGQGRAEGYEAREAFRGRAEQGRPGAVQPGARAGDRGGPGAVQPGARPGDRGGPGAAQPGARPGDRGTEVSRAEGARQPGAFEGVGQGAQTRSYSSRGAASRGGSFGGGMRGGGGRR
jgi:uncharacterized membrane protein YgcG